MIHICAPRLPIRCHALTTLRASRRRMAQHDNRVEKAIKGLTRAGIVSDLNKRRDMALYYLKASGEFDVAVRE